MNKSRKSKILGFAFAVAGFIVIGEAAAEVRAQDPFAKPRWANPKAPSSPSAPSSSAGVRIDKPKPAGPMVVGAPPVQDRIEYYKRLRETAALNNQPIPKPTLVMTLDELTVTGIFRTPRGYAAMVQANPINLSYAIYPGDKIFDGQLVAIEENRLVFRKVTKMSNGKFLASEQNKTLRQYTEQEVIQGTAPIEPSGRNESANNTPVQPSSPSADPNVQPAKPLIVISPLDEMNSQPPAKPANGKSKGKTNSAAAKKPVKVAKNKPE